MPIPTLLFLSLVATRQSDAFAPTSDHRWATEGIEEAVREGDLVLNHIHDYMNHGRPPSRYEVAVEFHIAIQNQTRRAEAFLKHPQSDVERASLIRSAALVPVYRRAIREFRVELTSLGANDLDLAKLEGLTRRIQTGAPARDRLFSDVPVSHWAAKAVGDMRALGLLDGYPDGRFRG